LRVASARDQEKHHPKIVGHKKMIVVKWLQMSEFSGK